MRSNDSLSSSITRRRFSQMLAAGVAPLFIPAHVLGRAGRIGANSRLGIGFIGVGYMCRGHIGWFLGRDDVQCIGVAEVDTNRREHAKKMIDDEYAKNSREGLTRAGAVAFNDHRELLATPGIDAVVIATPDHWHAIQCIDAVRAGKDVYCEKPLTLTIEESRRVIEESRRAKRVFQTGSQQRTEFDGRFRKACEYVRSGRLGTLTDIHVGIGVSSIPCDLPEESAEPGLDWDRWLGPAPMRPYNSILSPRGVHNHFPNWRLYREYSGGILTDWGAHHFDIAQWALDADTTGPVHIEPPKNPKATKGVVLTYANGVRVTHGGPFGVTFVGSEGLIYVDRDRIFSTSDKILAEPLTDKDVHLPQAADHRTNWLDCIRSREKPICDVEVGARSITVSHLANLAYWHQRPLTWDPAKWEFPGDAEANTWRDVTRRAGYTLPG